jgi:hypothetical protein
MALTLCLPILAITAAACAGPLRPDRLPEDAAWAVHADLELAGTTKLGRFTLGLINDELAETTIGDLKIRAGEDVRDITLFGWADEDAGGIVMATMTDAADRLIEHIKARETYEPLEREGQVIHSWLEPVPSGEGSAETGVKARIYALDLDADVGRLVLASDNLDALLKAVRVLRKDGPSRADATEGEARLPVEIPADAFLFFATTQPRPFGGTSPSAQVAKLADVIVLDMGERDGRGFVDLRVSARTEEEATQVAAVLQGLAALAQMMIPPDDEDMGWLRKLAEGVAFTADGLQVTAACLFDPDALIESTTRAGTPKHDKTADEEKPDAPAKEKTGASGGQPPQPPPQPEGDAAP